MRDPCRELFSELKILTFPSLYIYQIIILLTRIVNYTLQMTQFATIILD